MLLVLFNKFSRPVCRPAPAFQLFTANAAIYRAWISYREFFSCELVDRATLAASQFTVHVTSQVQGWGDATFVAGTGPCLLELIDHPPSDDSAPLRWMAVHRRRLYSLSQRTQAILLDRNPAPP